MLHLFTLYSALFAQIVGRTPAVATLDQIQIVNRTVTHRQTLDLDDDGVSEHLWTDDQGSQYLVYHAADGWRYEYVSHRNQRARLLGRGRVGWYVVIGMDDLETDPEAPGAGEDYTVFRLHNGEFREINLPHLHRVPRGTQRTLTLHPDGRLQMHDRWRMRVRRRWVVQESDVTLDARTPESGPLVSALGI